VEKERAHQVGTLSITCLGLFVVLLDSTVVTNALPTIGASLNASLSGLAWVVDSYILPFAVLLLLAGTLADRYGRKRLFSLGLVVFSLGAVICSTSPGLRWLEVGQAVCGASGAAIATGGMSLLVAAFPEPRQRVRAIGAYTALGGIALSAGPLLGGALVDTVGWRLMFLINLPVTVLALVAGWFVLRDSRNPRAQRADVPGQLTSIGGLTLLTYALIEANNRGWTSPMILGCLVGALMLLVTFGVVQARSSHPMMPLALFAKPTFSVSNLAITIVGFAMIGSTFFFSQYFQSVRGYSAFESGWATLPATLGMCTAPVATRMAARWGFRVPVVLGAALAGTGLLALTVLSPVTSYATIGWRLAIFGMGFGLMLAPLAATVVMAVPPPRAGLASAINNTARQLGAVLGVAALGTVVQHAFTTNVVTRLSALGLPPEVATSVAARASHHAAAPANTPPAVLAATGTAFTDALHIAFAVAGAAVLAMIIPCWLALRVSRPVAAAPQPQAPATPAVPKPFPPLADAPHPWYGNVAAQQLYARSRREPYVPLFDWFTKSSTLPDCCAALTVLHVAASPAPAAA
jgi:EmrB/QacA subfamily drug resistance transporter